MKKEKLKYLTILKREMKMTISEILKNIWLIVKISIGVLIIIGITLGITIGMNKGV